ncbi:FKBP-type peptidyl-prolyl cis-trans isomerase [Chryseosolibacter indicus]|uniref:Peptidyl-prolyl cis-trans isomerase n=1 Tax=Chryseosolibacter indicus TaxID=2782351 RepID=A0ABS5VS31_9BACT|nr:FKBP-type peptidyl-prolyl cis-trans isomerase [Chryseosolibacter indicus]MBT1704245.1 FKBP-type peptidyl-prolyl cis-trans isomerase [Chryseosolibacter indicus]
MKLNHTILSIFFASVSILSCMDDEDPNAQLNSEIKQIDSYLATSGLSDEAFFDNSSGIRFIVNNQGQYPPAHSGQKVKLSYSTSLFSDRTVISSSVIEEVAEKIQPQGLAYAVSALLGGSSGTFYVPSKYAYGATGATNIPANSTIIFTISSISVQKTSVEQAQFDLDTAAIHTFVKANDPDAMMLPSGVWYKITQPGSGPRPTPYSTISFDYTLKALASPNTTIQQSTLSNYGIFGLIDGLKVGLPQITQGSKVTFYIPSGLGYGPNGATGIAKNANLIFEINLTNVAK